MYICVVGIDLVYFNDFSIRFWNCYDGVVFLSFILFILTAMMAIVW